MAVSVEVVPMVLMRVVMIGLIALMLDTVSIFIFVFTTVNSANPIYLVPFIEPVN